MSNRTKEIPEDRSSQPDSLPVDETRSNSKTQKVLVELRGGSADAFQQLFYRWNRPVYGFLYKMLRSAGDAEDLTQDIFMRVWEIQGKIDPEKDIRKLIFFVARKMALNYLEKKKIRVDYLNNLQFNDKDPQSVEDMLAAIDIEAEAFAVIGNMPEVRQTIYRMSYTGGLDNKQISTALGLSPEKVKQELYLARKQLKEVLGNLLVIIVLMKIM